MADSQPRFRLGGTSVVAQITYAQTVGARVTDVADPHCRRCGHRALDHGLADLPAEERWRCFNSPRQGDDPRSCRFTSKDRPPHGCSCGEWDPEIGHRTLLEAYGFVPVLDAWVEASIGGGVWVAAYRLVPEGGHP